MPPYRRKLRSTYDLVTWVHHQLNPGLTAATWHLQRVPMEAVEPIVRAVWRAGARHGSAQRALELADALGLGDALEGRQEALQRAVTHPGTRALPAAIGAREDDAPQHVPREAAVRIRRERNRSTKP